MKRRLPVIVTRLVMAMLMAGGLLLILAGQSERAVGARTPDCPAPPITVTKIWRVMMLGGDPVACFGNRLLTFRAYVPSPATLGDPGVDGGGGPVLLPRWITDSVVALSSGPRAGQIPVSVPPALGRCAFREDDFSTCPFRSYWGRWVTVSAHFDGPVAQTCRWSYNDAGGGFTKRSAVAYCRSQLIVLSVGVLTPPETDATPIKGELPGDQPSTQLTGAAAVLAALLLIRAVGARRAARSPR